MLELDEQLPNYELKLADGTVKSYDLLLLSYKLRALDGEEDPAKIREIINKVFEIEVDAFDAMRIVKDFTAFSEEHLEGPLKKVFGPELFSTISTGSVPEKSEPSNQQSSSV